MVHRILELVAEAEPTSLQPLEATAVVIQKFWRGLKVSPMQKVMSSCTALPLVPLRILPDFDAGSAKSSPAITAVEKMVADSCRHA